MIVKEKIIDDYKVYLHSEARVYAVDVRKSGSDSPIFFRVYSYPGRAHRMYDSWCSKINELIRSEDCNEF